MTVLVFTPLKITSICQNHPYRRTRSVEIGRLDPGRDWVRLFTRPSWGTPPVWNIVRGTMETGGVESGEGHSRPRYRLSRWVRVPEETVSGWTSNTINGDKGWVVKRLRCRVFTPKFLITEFHVRSRYSLSLTFFSDVTDRTLLLRPSVRGTESSPGPSWLDENECRHWTCHVGI